MAEAPPRERRDITVRGIVQGVGFRPFAYALAQRHGLSGTVRNDAHGVHVEVEGPGDAVDRFVQELQLDPPPLALVETVQWRAVPVRGDTEFRIIHSREGTERRALVSPDVATCPACLAELFNPVDRRFRYPFINCTNCGPRFTITRSVPYDRATTTMAGFTMCAACRHEYEDPTDRRFHAQPNACSVCGPSVRLVERSGGLVPPGEIDPVAQTAELIRDGAIIAVKGIGGYHLACDPYAEGAVRGLRSRKARQDKPLALMARDLAEARTLCRVDSHAAEMLASPSRPIVLLPARRDAGVADAVAPRQTHLGLMLAYAPLHHLLLHDAGLPLVMTSGNRSDEPIAYRDEEAFEQLRDIADYVLMYDRPIHVRCDDSVVRQHPAFAGPYPIRRSRGFAPAPISLSRPFGRHVLACGAELKNTFCLAKDRHAFVSHHIGDLENYETLRSFTDGIEHFSCLFDVHPELVAHDLHPEYLSTKYARELAESGMETIGVQHHRAHIAACLTDNDVSVSERVIGVALDGTGYGDDGAIWGGEVFTGSIAAGLARRAYLDYVPLPGGEAAIRHPWRMALAYLLASMDEDRVLSLPLPLVHRAGERQVRLVRRLMETGINTHQTSSAGRLFDAVAALLDLPGTDRVTYEGQAAVELELAASGRVADGYPIRFRAEGDTWVVETGAIIEGIVFDCLAGRPAGEISARFHHTVGTLLVELCRRLRREGFGSSVVLSGGTFQNMRLLSHALGALDEESFTVYTHRRVPTNDGGISLGQAVLADAFKNG